ncbi:TetR/AcrR family transcriptional regulator [Saccharopolyspora mangrovi]|uniref:TetR family transcriptional regulator n=1 Tax=Saccharopolyspora mangrovi TaxID=3082379 RepID=A0ABU6A6F8_9PSEU|nr:TetR family transcriptional regulator [Saccharopolyspora sp. S2-29]MEB3367070.1 TetR family transcriptional regulator [Saccharopolyspora sp. S2-29]
MSTTEPKRRGRRPNGADTKEALLTAAREVFAEQGYDAATVRAIASSAGVDPAMVNHWFGGKEGLFTAAVQIPINPAEIVREVLEGPREQIGERIIRRFVTVWDGVGGGQFAALIRSVAGNEQAVTMLREFVQNVLFNRLVKVLGVDHPEMRVALCGSQLIGLGMARYVVRIDPLASADADAVAATIGPNLQHYLTGDLQLLA